MRCASLPFSLIAFAKTPHVRHILLATDLEASAPNVAAFALTLAEHFGAELTVFHTFGKPDLSLGARSNEQREETVVRKMREMMAQLSTETNASVVVHYKTDIDYAGDGILNQVEEGQHDLLVIGLRQARDGEAQFSALASRIFREANTAVLAVPPQASYVGINEIIFASDVDREDEVVLENLQEWRQKLGADLFVVHVYENDEDRERARATMNKWRERYASRPRLHFELMAGDFTHDITAYVAQRKGDMLVLQSQVRGLFEQLFTHSSAADVAQNVEVPLLVMRGSVNER